MLKTATRFQQLVVSLKNKKNGLKFLIKKIVRKPLIANYVRTMRFTSRENKKQESLLGARATSCVVE